MLVYVCIYRGIIWKVDLGQIVTSLGFRAGLLVGIVLVVVMSG